MFHFGHAKALEQCKKLFPNVHLLVGVCGDEVTHRLKGKTVMTEKERYESVRHCKWADEVIEDAPWVLTEEFLDEHQVDFVAHDAEPYVDTSGLSESSDDVYKLVKDLGMFVGTQRTQGISTSDLINRIVKDYDNYVRRNLKRGYDRKELGISYFKEKRIKMEDSVKDMGAKVSGAYKKADAKVDEMKKQIGENMDKWYKDNSQKFVEGFLSLFRKNPMSQLSELLSPPAAGSPPSASASSPYTPSSP
jgi:choline-phosphate cytidylyltransferase